MANQFSLPKTPAAPPLLRIEPFKGLNLSVTPTQIDDHQSPDMLNITIGVNGDANKRTGYQRIIPYSLGTGKVNGLYSFRKTDGTEIFLMAHGTKLYRVDYVPGLMRDGVWTDDDLTTTWG